MERDTEWKLLIWWVACFDTHALQRTTTAASPVWVWNDIGPNVSKIIGATYYGLLRMTSIRLVPPRSFVSLLTTDYVSLCD